jgi:general secretion pathway protein L
MNKSMENHKAGLAKLFRQLAGGRFLRWWLGELAGLVPAWLRSDGSGMDYGVLASSVQGDVILGAFEGGRIREMGRFPLNATDAAGQRTAFLAALDKLRPGQRDVALALPAHQVLRKSFFLPLATEENLRQVLEFQMDQHTPFTPGQVYFGYQVIARDFERGQLKIEFVATPRDAVGETLKMLAGWGALVRAVIAEDMLTNGNPVNMLPAVHDKTSSRLLRGANPWLAGLVLLLALAALVMPVVIKREAILQLNPWVEKGKKAAEATEALRRELESRVEEHNYLLEKKRQQPPVISVLEELTRVLPDDTWVQQMDVKGDELQIQGETGSSSRLAGLFEQSGMFHDASFRAPLTKGQGVGMEHYNLAIKIRPLPEPAPKQTPVAPARPAASPALPAIGPQTTAASNAPRKSDSKQPAPVMEKKP